MIKPLIKKSISVYLLNFALLGFLVGCTSPIIKEGDAPSGVDYVRWVPKEYRAPVEARLPRPKELWWQDFGSDELNSLVETAVTNNFDLRVAIARVAQTRAQADLVKSAQYPTLDAKAGYNSIAPYPNIGSAASTSQWTSQGTWQAGLLASYEVNLWGKQGFDTKSAFAQALASEFNREVVALSLVSDVVTVYFQLVSLHERITVAERNLETIRTLTTGLGRKVDKGDATDIDFYQQLMLLNNTDAQVTALRQQREQAFNRLATLVGRTPSTLKVNARSIEDYRVPVVEPGLPSDLLCRRPDIRRAEAQLEAAQFDLYSARAQFMPSFVLTAGGGYGSYLLNTLTMPQSLFYNITTNLVQNIFDGGKRKAQEQIASAKNVELVEAYANSVLSALREVEDSLTGIVLTAKAYDSLNIARDKAARLTVMSQRVMELGGIDYVQIYEIQRTVFNTQDAAITARYEQLRASVSLFKSIGGGTKLKADPCLGGGNLPKADERWIDRANKQDAVFAPKPPLGINSKGEIMLEGDGTVLKQAIPPGTQNVKP
ncbi:MAG: efflux transporter outer membrane subunit [Polynucleobacter sp.]|nr:efflux transporter outer membrane subunit [Polynucleobacter sp.]